MKLLNLDSVKSSINHSVNYAFIIIFSISVVLMTLAKQQNDFEREQRNELRLQAIIDVQNYLASEKLRLIASAMPFVDYIRSGVVTRKQLQPAFERHISRLRERSIVGMEIEHKEQGLIYEGGLKTPYYITLDLCYLDWQVNSDLGACRYLWSLYFSKQDLINRIQSTHDNLAVCSSCKAVDMFDTNRYGVFPIIEHTPLSINITDTGSSGKFYYVYLVLVITTLLAFALWNKYRIQKKFDTYIAKPLQRITGQLSSGTVVHKDKNDISEISYLIEKLELWKQKFDQAKQQEADAELGHLLSQLVHDIRSPLTAISVISKNLPEVDADKRKILSNAAESLNNLLSDTLFIARNKYLNTLPQQASEPIIILLMDSIAGSRVQYMLMGEQIRLLFLKPCHLAFVKANSTELTRVLSNLIRNAIEATEGKHQRKIEIIVDQPNKYFLSIKIRDNGCGIPPELLSKVSSGNYTSKVHGNGLGLMAAKKLVSDWGGIFSIQSVVNISTTVQFTVPLGDLPDWCVTRIVVHSHMSIVILDDEHSIHLMWKEKINQLACPDINVHYFNNPQNFFNTYDEYNVENTLFLIDYDMGYHELNGFDVINKMSHKTHVHLVTSHSRDNAIREQAKQLGISILPKELISYISIICIDR